MRKILVSGLLVVVLSVLAGMVLAQEEPDPQHEPEVPVFQIAPAENSGTQQQPIVIPASQGFIPVIVELSPSARFIPEGRMSAADAMSQRAAILRTQESVLDTFEQAGIAPANVHLYETIPYMAMHVDAAGLAALQNNPDVLSVRADEINEIFVNLSTPVIGAPTVWDMGYQGNGYSVVILDTGVDSTHEAFSDGKIINEACFNTTTNTGRFKSVCPGGVDEVNGPGAAAPDDCIGCDHGTHVAGIAAGNNSSVVGLTSTSLFRGTAPGATIIAINAFSVDTITDRPGAFDSDVLQALEYVYTLASVGTPGGDPLPIASINMSLGAGTFTDVCDADNGDYVDIVDQLASVGVATVAASGNQGSKNALSKPACISNVVSVGATTVEASSPDTLQGDDGTVAFFSNGNEDLDLLAPGFFVTSSVPGGGYEQKRGTSQAAPFVAGAWAIMRQLFPDATPAEILAQFKLTGKPVTDNGQTTSLGSSPGNGLTYPLIQLDKAIVPSAPVLLTPLNQTVSDTPTFSWEDMPLTDRYDVRVYETDTNIVVGSQNNIRSACSEGICSFPTSITLRDNVDYYWTVQGKTPQGITSTVARGDFVIRGIKPQGDTITGTPEFIFEQNPTPGITYYELEVSTRPTVQDEEPVVLHREWYEAKDICEATVCTIDTGLNFGLYVGDRELQWRYRTYNENTIVVSEEWEGPYNFTILAPTFFRSTGVVTDDSGIPTFSIRELTADEFTASWYRFYIVNPEDFSPVQDYWMPVTDAECINGVCEFTPGRDPYNRLLYNGDYSVYVNAFTDDQGYSAWSKGDEFSVNAAAPSINWVTLENLYNSRLVGLTETAADHDNPCDLTGTSIPTCGVSRPYLEFSYNNGGFSGEWFEIILYRPADNAVLYQDWMNVYNPNRWENLTCVDGTTTTSPRCTVGSPAYLGSGTYQWYLRSWGPGGATTGGLSGYTAPGGAGDPNGIAEFQVDLPDSVIQGMTVTFYADLPTGATTTRFDGELTFEWDVAEGADYYQLVVERANAEEDEDPIHNQWYHVGEDILCGERSCSIVTDDTFPNGGYVWRVVYWNGELSDPVEGTFNLNLPRPELPFIADMVVYNNENVSNNTRLIYQWERLPNTMWYNVQVLDASGNEMFAEWYRARDICDASYCGVWPDLNLVSGRYEWYVKPWGPGGFAVSNEPDLQGKIGPATFRMSSTTVGLPAPLTPVDVTVQTSKPVFYWEPATNGAWYQIEIVNQESKVLLFDGWVYAPPSLCSKNAEDVVICSAKPNIDIANGTDYGWRIRSYGPSGFGQWTEYFGFAVNSPQSKVPILIGPLPGATFTGGAEPVFVWSDVDALWYRLEVSEQNGGVVYSQWLQETSDELTCNGTNCMQSLPKSVDLNGLYEWNVTTWSPGNGSLLQQTKTIKFASY